MSQVNKSFGLGLVFWIVAIIAGGFGLLRLIPVHPRGAIIIDCDVPGAEVYAGPIKLGTTPIVLTENVLRKLPVHSTFGVDETRNYVRPHPHGLLLLDSPHEGSVLWFGFPENELSTARITHNTPWGRTMELSISSGNRKVTAIRSRSRPGNNTLASAIQVTCDGEAPERLLSVRLTVTNSGQAEQVLPREFATVVSVGQYCSVAANAINENWRFAETRLGPGKSLSSSLTLECPNVPGRYLISVALRSGELDISNPSSVYFEAP